MKPIWILRLLRKVNIMDKELKIVTKNYIENVNRVCINLLDSYNLKNKFDFFEYRRIHSLVEFKANGIKYRLHGKGCLAFNDEMYIDWDFGYRSRWCGVDPWLLATTLERNKDVHIKYYNGSLIKEAYEQAVIDGEMFKKNHQYYLSILMNDTFIPNFPKEYDTLVIKHFDKQWVLSRNKTIDRFIKKSTRVYNEIVNSPNPYILVFFLNNKEIYNILYDDIGYPQKAIEIMDSILIEEAGGRFV